MWARIGKFAIKMLATWGLFEGLDAAWKKLTNRHDPETLSNTDIVTESDKASADVMALIAPLMNNMTQYIPEPDPRNADLLLKSSFAVATSPIEDMETRIVHADVVCQILGVNYLDLTLEEMADRLVALSIEDNPYSLAMLDDFYDNSGNEKDLNKFLNEQIAKVVKDLKDIKKDQTKMSLLRRVIAAHELALGGVDVEGLAVSSQGNIAFDFDSSNGRSSSVSNALDNTTVGEVDWSN